jgi:hypothetical protein
LADAILPIAWLLCHAAGGNVRTGNVTRCDFEARRSPVTTTTILLIVLIVLLIAAVPTWPYSRGWGYYPSGGLGLLLVILIVLLLLGYV